jgi:hypothetical protein
MLTVFADCPLSASIQSVETSRMLLITLTSCKKQVWSLAMLLLVSLEGGRRVPAQIQKSRFDSDVWLQNVLIVKCSNHKEAF